MSKQRKCLSCSQWFEASHGTQHLCDSCELEIEVEQVNDQVERELADPAVRARIESAVAKRLEEL